MAKIEKEGLYGTMPFDGDSVALDAVQFSPFCVGAERLEDCPQGSLARFTVVAPAGTLERRYVLALALRALVVGGRLQVLAPKDKGGTRLDGDLRLLGCADIDTASRRHYRFCCVERPVTLTLDEALAQGALQLVPATGLFAQPGVFGWNKTDAGSALLIEHMPVLAGRGADLGCGCGVLARAVLERESVTRLDLVDLDRRALDAARRNLQDPRLHFHWADATREIEVLRQLDFVVMNPPFHDEGVEDHGLGQLFIRRAQAVLKPGGVCWLVANRHLPYEAVLKTLFARVTLKADAQGFKVIEAVK